MKSILAVLLCSCSMILIISTPALSTQVYPGEIQACVNSSLCTAPALVQQETSYSVYTYTDGGTPKYLFHYNLWSSSIEATNFSTTQLSGTAWISANATYDLAQQRHFFMLYLDNVTPIPTNLWLGDSDGLDIGLSMPTSDLLSGSSFIHWGSQVSGSSFRDGNLGTHGDIPGIGVDSFVPCLAFTCEIGATFNLLYMQYVQSGSIAQLALNPGDQRSLLYSQYQDYAFDNTWYRSQFYEVVPVPQSVWLFGSGLLGLVGIARRKKAAY